MKQVLLALVFVLLLNSCGSDSPTTPAGPETGTKDGSSWVKIGNTKWTTKNARITHYRNGDEIKRVYSYEEWRLWKNNGCVYIKEILPQFNVYEYYYNLAAVKDSRGLVPSGWSLPTSHQLKEITEAANYDFGNLKSGSGWDIYYPNKLGLSMEPSSSAFAGYYLTEVGYDEEIANPFATFWAIDTEGAYGFALLGNNGLKLYADGNPKYNFGCSLRLIMW